MFGFYWSRTGVVCGVSLIVFGLVWSVVCESGLRVFDSFWSAVNEILLECLRFPWTSSYRRGFFFASQPAQGVRDL